MRRTARASDIVLQRTRCARNNAPHVHEVRVSGNAKGNRLAAALLAAALMAAPLPALAQQAAHALDRRQVAQKLAERSIECLDRGEDGISRETRLSAYREGLELAKRAVAADDLNADAHFALFANKGRILLLEGATANPFTLMAANRELDRTLELNPNHTKALTVKGGLYRQLPRLLGGSLDKAEAYLRRAIQLDPNAIGARIELAAAYRDMGQPHRSVPLLEQAVQVAQHHGRYRQLVEARLLLRRVHAEL